MRTLTQEGRQRQVDNIRQFAITEEKDFKLWYTVILFLKTGQPLLYSSPTPVTPHLTLPYFWSKTIHI